MELEDEDLRWAGNAIRSMDMFSVCTDAEVQELLSGLEKQTYNSGATILFQGEISSRLAIIKNGTVSVNIRQGREKNKVAELGPNSFFGEISLLTPRAATATIKAETSVEIFYLPGEVVKDLVKKNPVLSKIINKKIEERLEAGRKSQKTEEIEQQPPGKPIS